MRFDRMRTSITPPGFIQIREPRFGDSREELRSLFVRLYRQGCWPDVRIMKTQQRPLTFGRRDCGVAPKMYGKISN